MNPKQMTIIRLLAKHPEGLYGSEIAELSGGILGRGTVYTVLQIMVDKGFVRAVEERGWGRTRHFITEEGMKLVKTWE